MLPPKQTDNQAASSANPDTDRLPAWDDEGWDAYLYAVDKYYRFDWDVSHGVSPEDAGWDDDWDDDDE